MIALLVTRDGGIRMLQISEPIPVIRIPVRKEVCKAYTSPWSPFEAMPGFDMIDEIIFKRTTEKLSPIYEES